MATHSAMNFSIPDIQQHRIVIPLKNKRGGHHKRYHLHLLALSYSGNYNCKNVCNLSISFRIGDIQYWLLLFRPNSALPRKELVLSKVIESPFPIH